MPIFGTYHTEGVRGMFRDLAIVITVVALVIGSAWWTLREVEEIDFTKANELAQETKAFLDSAEEIPYVTGKGYEISKEHEIYITQVIPFTAGKIALLVRAFEYPKDMIFEVPRDRISEFIWFFVSKSRHREPEDTKGRHMVYEAANWMLWRTTYYGPLPSEERVMLASCDYNDKGAKALLKWLTD